MENEMKEVAAHFTTDSFEADVLKHPGVVLVDFWATWCGPCKIMGPRVEEVAQKYKDNPKVSVGKVDIDANSELSEKYKVLSIPTFKVFVGGEPVDQRIGVVATAELEMMVEKALEKMGGDMGKEA